MKKCRGPCGELKNPSCFKKGRRQCKDCIIQYNKTYRREHKKEISNQRKEYTVRHKNDIAKQSKIYRAANKEKEAARRKEYSKSHKEKISERGKIYRKKYKEKILNQKNQYKKEKRIKDPVFRLREYVSINIVSALKGRGSTKNGQSILNYLPYSLNELILHLSSLFESWMNWENHGRYIPSMWNDADPITWKWQLDHIIPQSDLPYTSMEDDNFKKCWALSNLRPLSAKQNIIDGANRTRQY